jgi:HD-GYP domain-containing protein (c-di-GMP phosphodiesterase class II)
LKTGADRDEGQFRLINIRYMDVAATQYYDVFYKTSAFGTTRFVKFASSHPSHQDKVRRLIESGESTQDFYIHEEDIAKYHQQATRSLRNLISNPKIPLKEKTEKIYDVSQEVMKDFFEYNASEKILQSSEELIDIMEKCLFTNEAGFHSISMITNKDYYTYTHSVNVGLYCLAYGMRTQLGPNDTRDLGLGGMLHDVGKSRIDHNLINKNGKLTDEEFKAMKNHSAIGKEILESMKCYKTNIVEMANQHHEKFNGNGYPNGLVGDEISMFARICKVMDVYDALTTRRSYKKAMSPFDALTIMEKQMVDEFDLKILKNFIRFMGPHSYWPSVDN